MSHRDWLNDTPVVVNTEWCPTCTPDLDPTTRHVITRYCFQHQPSARGRDDDSTYNIYSQEEKIPFGVMNRWWCDFIHRRKLPQ